MKARRIAVAAAFLLVFSATVSAGDPPKAKDLVSLEKKLVGVWVGQGGVMDEWFFRRMGHTM